MTQNKLYTVVQQGQNHFNIVDLHSGVFVNRIVTQGNIVSGPIVVGDRCTFIIEVQNGVKQGMIYSLPQGTIINRYIA